MNEFLVLMLVVTVPLLLVKAIDIVIDIWKEGTKIPPKDK